MTEMASSGTHAVGWSLIGILVDTAGLTEVSVLGRYLEHCK